MNESEASKEITLIAAASENNALGKNNQLIWHLSEDLKRFKRLTQGHSIIMGRKTFESLPKGYKAQNAWVVNTIEEALKLTEGDLQPFIIGGGEIYKLFLSRAHSIELTRVHGTFEADTFFPEIDYKNWELIEEEKHLSSVNQPFDYSFLKFRKIK